MTFWLFKYMISPFRRIRMILAICIRKRMVSKVSPVQYRYIIHVCILGIVVVCVADVAFSLSMFMNEV